MMDSKPYAQEAEVKRLELIVGLTTVDEIVAWADGILRADHPYDDDVANLSLGRRASETELISWLDNIARGADKMQALRCMLGNMHRVLSVDRTNAGKFVKELFFLYTKNIRELPKEMSFMTWYWDQFDLAQDGILSAPDAVIDDLLQELSRYDV